MSNKQRPPNAAGPNGLRGGIKTYNPKTITGPWQEELGGPAGYKRGFTTTDYETEAQHQQLGAFKQSFPDFGSHLPDDSQLKRPTSPFKYDTSLTNNRTSDGFSPWLSNTKIMGLSAVTRKTSEEVEKENNNIYSTVLKPKMPIRQLESYRSTWTHDTNDSIRQIRWTTETNYALNHSLTSSGDGNQKRFITSTIRPLPGTPKTFETFRKQLIDKYGILSFMIMKNLFFNVTGNNDYNNHNTNEVTIGEFKRILLNQLSVGLKIHDINQMVAYITTSSTAVPIDKFMYTLKGNMNSFDKIGVNDLFQRIISNNQLDSNTNQLKLDHILGAINYSQYPEVFEGFSQYLSVYSNNNQFSKGEFFEFMQDMYAASPELYEESLKSMWSV